VVAAAADAPSFLEAVTAHRPDVAVVDVRMPPRMSDD
jgi:CheY-like chemotaxis protein